MTNPYESPKNSSREINASPFWYLWFYRAFWPMWWGGMLLVALSWLGVVTPDVGWVGFALAIAAALGSYVLPSLAGVKPEDCVILDSRLINSRGDAYHDAIERFRNGASLFYDGVAFGFRPSNEIACAVVAGTTDLDDKAATELAGHAQSVFDKLVAECTEFRSAVAGRTFRISIMSGGDQTASELCRVIDGKFDWRR